MNDEYTYGMTFIKLAEIADTKTLSELTHILQYTAQHVPFQSETERAEFLVLCESLRNRIRAVDDKERELGLFPAERAAE